MKWGEDKMDIQTLLDMVNNEGASDLIISAGARPQMRVNGILIAANDQTITPDISLKMGHSLITPEQKEILRIKRSLEISYGCQDVARFRISMYYQRDSLAIAIRRIPSEIPDFEALGLPDIVHDFANEPHGLILITGPAGSGKSTTLAAMINQINTTKHMHVICIEDPIEYVHTHCFSVVDQREIGGDTPDFAAALRSVFRQSPDVIMIGEMRDLETMQLALTLAETGHLILATLHTQDATHSINRIVDSFSSDQQKQIYVQLSMVLKGVISQRLITSKDRTKRVLAYEVMQVNDAISNLIREMAIEQIYSVIQTSSAKGMCTLNDCLAMLYKKNLIEKDIARRMSPRLKEIDRLLERKG